MDKRVELPIAEALYSTYHYQGPGTAIAINNPTVRNWFLNHTVNLICNRKFLKGFTSPEITVDNSSWWVCPYFERIEISSRFAKGFINPIIREMLNNGYYVAFINIDDYYVEGKSWHKERHFNHDGIICGYDQNDKTYCLYAYDNKWIYRKFWTSQKSFNSGRVSTDKQGKCAVFYAVKVKDDVIEFLPHLVYSGIKEYLDSDMKKYPPDGEEKVYGIVVHQYIAEYVSLLYKGEIPYERMDRRVFRVIWEHKKAMLERIELVEKKLGMNSCISQKYASLVSDADRLRMMYATYHMNHRNSILPEIQKKLLKLMKDERLLLKQLLKKMERKL